MNNSTQDSLKSLFKRLLDKPDYVYVEHFQNEMQNKNNLLKWNDKETDLKDFETIIIKWNPNEFELYYEGFRCLAQIFINLLKDFEIFKIYPIRKYSSGFNYISKIDNHESILSDIGYIENEKEKNYKLDSKLTNVQDVEKAFEKAFYLLICFMELSELIKLRYELCESQDLIVLRQNNINKQIENHKYDKLTDDEILKLFQKCELCEDDVDMESKQCGTCGSQVQEFSIAYRFRDFLRRKFEIEIPELQEAQPENPKPTDDESTVVLRDRQNKQDAGNANSDNNTNWKCAHCTYLNDASNLNCVICESAR